MVEHGPPAQRPRQEADREQGVGRVVEVDDVGPAQELEGAAAEELRVRHGVLEQEARRAPGGSGAGTGGRSPRRTARRRRCPAAVGQER